MRRPLLARPAKLRSGKLTNDPTPFTRALIVARGGGRRYLDIAEAVAAQFPDASTVALRELASLRFTLEREQGAMRRQRQSQPRRPRSPDKCCRKERGGRCVLPSSGRCGCGGRTDLRTRLAGKYSP